jgi:hypothetical protein
MVAFGKASMVGTRASTPWCRLKTSMAPKQRLRGNPETGRRVGPDPSRGPLFPHCSLSPTTSLAPGLPGVRCQLAEKHDRASIALATDARSTTVAVVNPTTIPTLKALPARHWVASAAMSSDSPA